MSTPGGRPLAVVTGASSGLGEVFARNLASKGYRLLLVARREERLSALAALLGPNHEVMAADLTKEEDLERLARRLEASADLRLLVNNAGFGTKGLFWETDYSRQVEMHKLGRRPR